MGYLIVGQKIDPHDWRQPYGKQVPAQDIIDEVMHQTNSGNIILFHDGGGDRSQTLAALPQVIDQLRARGFEFVSVPELVNKTRGEVMVPLSGRERLGAEGGGFILRVFHWFAMGLRYVFMI